MIDSDVLTVVTAHAVATGSPGLWRCLVDGHEVDFVLGTGPGAGPWSLLDVLVLEGRASHAEAREALTWALRELTGLALAATTCPDGTCLFAARTGEVVAVPGAPAVVGAALAYLGTLVGCGLGGLSSVTRAAPHGAQPGGGALELWAAHFLGQRHGVGEVPLGGRAVTLLLAHLAEGQQGGHLVRG
ncbi:hypothetical protein [Actinokineospora diospyrosa]|uniref:Uncharacterized protein n=1 Tax=Actinokineospora diospyrosa TaxID=103728 RepID=A0ABT1I9W5_9PSEU|nr:hypothetical protein [Actinokineospora diospyrosa]MCP2269426.1 hypothetical protein [Actinokineospora diospyrosa]